MRRRTKPVQVRTSEPTLDELVTALDECSLWASHFGSALLDRFEPAPGLRVLDVGCGTGFPTIEIAGRLGPSCSVVGVDVWHAALERARRKASLYRVSNLTFVEADAARLPFGDGEFDRITSNLGLNNFENPEGVLRECARVAKPGATLVLTTNVRGHMREFYRVFRRVVRERCDRAAQARCEANEAHRGTPRAIAVLVARCGFTVSRVDRREFTWWFGDGTALFGHPLVRVGFLPGWRAVPPSRLARAVFADLEARLNAIAKKRGGLRLTIPVFVLEATRNRSTRAR
ncbi:MAG: methyltransferase domain-containing protein [Planctomycetes bacterium]|nr:methyltransferase domain-containing protein [Planctomycetota bacterium]